MTDAAVRVHLADDHTMFREGLAAILSSREGVEVVGQTSTGAEAVAAMGRLRPDVVVTQLDMRVDEAREVLFGIRSASPDSRIVVLTMLDNVHYLKALAQLGIDAYLHKSSSAEELIDTVDVLSAARGGPNAVVSMPRGLLERLGNDPAGPLSERETEVLVLAARGYPNRRIAEELHLMEATVKRHLANVYEKVGARSRTEAVRTALEEQWIGINEVTSAKASPDGSG